MALICPSSSEYNPSRWRAADDKKLFHQFLDWQAIEKRVDHVACEDDVMIQLVRHPQMASSHPRLRTVRWFRGGAKAIDADALASALSSLTLKADDAAGSGADSSSGGGGSSSGLVMFVEVDSGEGYNKANSFMNIMCHCPSCGDGKGWFCELNMYAKPGSKPSAHHMSTVMGVVAARNTADDGKMEATKGPHWRFGAGFQGGVSSGRPVIELLVADLQRPSGGAALLWQRVSAVLTHDDWYSKEDISRVRAAAASSSNLTPKQRQTASKLGPQRREEDDYYESD